MSNLTQECLVQLFQVPESEAHAARWLAPLSAATDEWQINTPHRLAAFLAQILHESNHCRSLAENLHYSAPRLMQVWPSRFKTSELAEACAANPERLANTVYAGRLGNGDADSGDGWRYRGRGLIQLTGRDNYARCARGLGLDLLTTPHLLESPEGAARSAAWFWAAHGLNELADPAPGKDNAAAFLDITKRINGGTIGQNERAELWSKALSILGASAGDVNE